MPIRFRCAYCNQLMGIARRKAGTVVRCPTCAGQVVVPSLEEAGLTAKDDRPGKPPSSSGPQNIFEGDDVDKMLEGAAGDQPSVIAPGPDPGLLSVPAPQGAKGGGPAPVRPPNFPPPMLPNPGGIVLSPTKATVLSVLVVLAVAISFGLGLLLGMYLIKRAG